MDKKSLCRLVAVCSIAISFQSCNFGSYPTVAEDWDKQACEKYRRGEFDQATNDWDKAVVIAPENPDYFWKRSRATIRFGREQQAVDDALKAIELLGDKDPRKLIYFYLQLGNSYAKRGQFDDAKKSFAKAIELAEGKVDAAPVYMERGRVLLLVGDPKGAIEDLTKAISIVPTLGRAYFYRAKAYEAANDPVNAAKDFEKARTMDYDNNDDKWEPMPID